MAASDASPHYQEPGRFTRYVFNPSIAWLTRRGISVWGSRELRVPILRAYLKRWKAEVGVFFDGVSAKSSEADLIRIAPDHPVFRIDNA